MTRTTRVALAAVLAAALILTATVAGAAVRRAVGYEPARTAAPHVIHKGGVVRLGPDPYLHVNESHAAIGVTHMTLEDCAIVLHLDYEPGQRVMAAVVDEDETISRLGVQAGISGGNTKATIRMWDAGTRVCPRDTRFTSTSNLWVSITVIDSPDTRPVP